MKSAVLTKAALCICPPAVIATTAATVPPVRKAVHRFTAAYEPKSAVKPAAAPCVPVDRAAFSSQLPNYDLPPIDLTPPGAYSVFTPPGGDTTVPINPGFPLTPVGPGAPDNPNNTPGVPEPGVWLTMVVGFGLIGAGFRQKRRYTLRSRKLALATGGSSGGIATRGMGAAVGGLMAAGTATVPMGLSPAQAGTKLASIGSKALHSSLLAKAAMCVCPPVALAVGTAAIPPVRHAVYNATAPKTPQSPRTTLGSRPQGAPCVPVVVPTAAESIASRDSTTLPVLNNEPNWPS